MILNVFSLIIPCKEVKSLILPVDIECIFIEINLRKKKWLVMGSYYPHRENISYFLIHVSKALDKLLGDYDNLLLLGDFNSSVSERGLKDFCDVYNLENLIKCPTCFKNAENPSPIDVMLTNRNNAFKNSMTIESGLPDHHKLTISVLTTYFKKKEHVKINYRSYKNFDETAFRNDLLYNLQNCDSNAIQYDEFKDFFMKVLNHHAPNRRFYGEIVNLS